MSIDEISSSTRTQDLFHHIDMGFLNRRLCMTALPSPVRAEYGRLSKPGSDHHAVLNNDHLLVTMLLDVCDAMGAPTLMEALARGKPRQTFRSTERLLPCPEVRTEPLVDHSVLLDVDFGKPVRIRYHTSHIVSDTGRMILEDGYKQSPQSIVGVLHDKDDHWSIQPLVIGAPWFDHPRNRSGDPFIMWMGRDLGEILAEDIEQFAKLKTVEVETAETWMEAMRDIPEAQVKQNFAALLADPTKKDWGGEMNDHFSASVTVDSRRQTAAFLLKPTAQPSGGEPSG